LNLKEAYQELIENFHKVLNGRIVIDNEYLKFKQIKKIKIGGKNEKKEND